MMCNELNTIFDILSYHDAAQIRVVCTLHLEAHSLVDFI